MTTDSSTSKRYKVSIESVLFLAGLLLLVFPIFNMGMIITLDGPNHLYSAKVFGALLSDNSFYEQFIQINPEFVPNYLTVFLLYPLQRILDPIDALKVFHLLHVLFMIGGAFYWSNAKTKKITYPFFILPFVYSYLFFSGFYNFIFGASLLLWTLGYLERKSASTIKIGEYLWIGCLFFLLYFSHLIPFLFAGLYLFIDLIVEMYQKADRKKIMIHGLKLAIVILPTLIFSLLFVGSRDSSISYLDVKTLISRWVTAFSITIKDPDAAFFKLGFTMSLFTLLIYAISQKNVNKTMGITLLCILLLYFILPDSVGYASVFSVRIEYLFWIIAAIGAGRQLAQNYVLRFLPALVSLVLLGYQIPKNNDYLNILNGHANSVFKAAEHIPNESVVYPIFNSLYWDDLHISNLAGTQKDLMILENTQARQDYFPVIYRHPYEDCIEEQRTISLYCEDQEIEIQYVLVIGKLILENQRDIEIYKIAMESGEMIYANSFVQLFKISH